MGVGEGGVGGDVQGGLVPRYTTWCQECGTFSDLDVALGHHEEITGRRGSHAKSQANIAEAAPREISSESESST